MSPADWVAVYGAVSGTLGSLIAWRAYALAKRTAVLDGPHIEVSGSSADHPEWIYYSLGGPRADQWTVTRAELMWAGDIQICRKDMQYDSYGELVIAVTHPQGRILENPDSPIVLSGSPRPSSELIFTLRLKANLQITRRCRVPFH